MKISLAITALILLAVGALGYRSHHRLVSIRETHETLSKEVAGLGIDPETAGSGKAASHSRAPRADKEATARTAAAEFLAFAREMEAAEERGDDQGMQDPKMQERIIKIMDLMMSLDADQLKIVVSEVRDADNLKADTRQGIVGFAIMTLASDHPQSALTLYTESKDLFDKRQMGRHVVNMALAQWAKDDPLAAADWLRQNREKNPELATQQVISGLIAGTVESDLPLAFSLAAELHPDEPHEAIDGIARSARTDEQRTQYIQALRTHTAGLESEKQRAATLKSGLTELGRNIAREGFTDAVKWIDSQELTDQEKLDLVSGIRYHNTRKDTGKWIEWFGDNLPADKAGNPISNSISRWTREDYRAAGEWLASAPDGPAKNPAVSSYAETVAPYDPETAAQWALTLPEGPDRTSTLQKIYQQWPDDDKAAKQAFGEKHQLKDQQ